MENKNNLLDRLKTIKAIIANHDLQTFCEVMYKAGTTRDD
jgi:hypothetical protein